MEEGGEGGKRKGGRGTETEGESHEGGNYTLTRVGSGRRACKDRQASLHQSVCMFVC